MMRDLLYYAQLGVEAVLGVFGLRLYEEPRYAVIGPLPGGGEVRRYDARLAAEVRLAGTLGKEGADRAFRLLFAYIAGANRGGTGEEKIAMTVPVEVTGRGETVAMTAPVETAAAADGTQMRFFLPARFTSDTAPQPSDPRVRLVAVPEETVAVVRFSGTPDEAEISRRRAALLAALEDSPWRAASDPVVLLYDAPFTLPFVRRNEVAVMVVPR
jgi:hypothetical protein